MATSLTNYAEEMLLKLAVGAYAPAAPPPAPAIWMALGLWEGGTYGPWTETGTGGTEIPGGPANGYQRVQIHAGDWSPMVSETEVIPGNPVGVPIRRGWSDTT